MRVVFIVGHTKALCWYFMDTMKTFLSRGHEIIACGNDPETQWEEFFSEAGILYRQIYIERNGTNPFSDIRTLHSIYGMLKILGPDKVFAFQAKAIIYSGIATRLLGKGEFYPLFAGAGSIFIKNDFKTKLIRKILVLEYKAAMQNSVAVFFQNNDDVELLRNYKILTKQRIVMLHGSGVNTTYFSLQPMPKKPAFLFVGRLIRDKGVVEYLEASAEIVRKYPMVRCMLVGPFDTNISAVSPDELKPFLDKGIEYFGEQEDVRPFIKQCSVFVLPSYREGTPKATLEAMACGRAVITTDVTGCRETVIDKLNGLLIPPYDSGALVEAMEYLINNPHVVRCMAVEGRKMAETMFSSVIVDKAMCDAMGLN